MGKSLRILPTRGQHISTDIAPLASMDRASVGRQFAEPEIVNLTVVAVATINGRNCLAPAFK